MNLQRIDYPTPQGKTADIVDLDRDGGEGQPLIVARVFEPDVMELFLAAPELLEALKSAQSIMWMAEHYAEAGGSRSIEMENYNEASTAIEAAIKQAEGK